MVRWSVDIIRDKKVEHLGTLEALDQSTAYKTAIEKINVPEYKCAIQCEGGIHTPGLPSLAAFDALPNRSMLDPFVADVQRRTFRFFWETANPANGLEIGRAHV